MGRTRHAHTLASTPYQSLHNTLTPPHKHPQWQELAQLYLQAGQPRLAAVCLEEPVLAQPHNFAHHAALAEAYYTCAGAGGSSGSGGGDDDASPAGMLRLARKHFAQAVELLQGETARPHLRALYGLCTVGGWVACCMCPSFVVSS